MGVCCCILLGLTDDLEDMPQNAGIVDATTGFHLKGTDRDGEIPVICKRNLFRKYRKLCQSAGARTHEEKSYLDHKNICTTYKRRKNEFFMKLDSKQLGRFPIMDRQVDTFWLLPEDLKKDD